MKITFKKPITFEGKTYKEIKLDLDSLTGEDLEQAQSLTVVEGKIGSSVPEFSKPYLAQLAAKASKMPVELIRALKAKDYSAITMEVQNFLLDTASEAEPTQESKSEE